MRWLKHLQEHLRLDHQAGVVSNVIIDHDQRQIAGKSIADRPHHFFLVLQQDVHQFFDHRPVVVEQIEGIGDTDGQHGAVKEGGQVGDHANPGSLGGDQVALQVTELGIE